MSSNLALSTELAPVVACTISRDVEAFDLLIEDMELNLGEAWGDLSFDEAIPFFQQPDATSLEFVAIAVDAKDEVRLAQISAIIHAAKDQDIKVILIAGNLSPVLLHGLLRDGADDFVPYPLPENALAEAIARIQEPAPAQINSVAPAPDVLKTVQPSTGPEHSVKKGNNEPVVFAIHGLSGGAGATTFAVNLAWELANIDPKDEMKICVLDLDLQFGTVATYLDLQRREIIYDILADTPSMDEQAFRQTLLKYRDKVDVFTAPADILPLDLIGPEDVKALIALAKECFDVVIIEMPTTLVSWTETVLTEADIYFACVELELRSAQNVLRMVKALKTEQLPLEKVAWVLNRAPVKSDGKARIKRLQESLGVEFRYQLPDGGKQITDTSDHGVPLSEGAPKNALRKEIVEIAKVLHAAAVGDEDEQGKTKAKKRKSLFSFGR